MRPIIPKTLVLVYAAFQCLRAEASLDPPRLTAGADSSGVLAEKGIEFLRTTERVNMQMRLPMRFSAEVNAQWKTDWQTPEGQTDRIRQDGRWYTGISRYLWQWTNLWLAASGEHLDDRPYNLPHRGLSAVDLFPNTHAYNSEAVSSPSQSVSAVRILRGGVGLSVSPWKPLKADAAVGPVQDRRIGGMSSGVGMWTHLAVENWNLAGYDQSLALQYDRETPRNHNSEDLKAHYEVYRQFFEGNTDRAEVSFNTLGQDVYLDALGRSGRRIEQGYAARNVLTYGVTRGVNVEMGGDVAHEKTEQRQMDVAASSLEENQAGFTSAVQAKYKQASGELQLGVRSITQTIRGDILQGHKTDLAFEGRISLPARSTLALRTAASKYSLDTKSTSNYDDRDELRYTIEAAWSKPFMRTFTYELHALTELDHLVYIFKQSSANNRWTRLFLLGSSVHHHPVPGFDQFVTASVSANYQDYDYDIDPRTMRSTVYRRLVLGDSLNLELSRRFGLNGKVVWQQEEFGRLFWSSFSEERSDLTRSVTASLQAIVRLGRSVRAGSGALWDSRRGERYPSASAKALTQLVFQDLRSYGPMVTLEKTGAQGLFINLDARLLRQYQLDRKVRWVSLGVMGGGIRW